MNSMLPVDFSFVLAAVVGVSIFILSQLGIGFFREVGSKTAKLLPLESSETPSVYIEGHDFDVEVDEDGTVSVSTQEISQTRTDIRTAVTNHDVQEMEDSPKIIVEGVNDRMILKSVLDYFCQYSNGAGFPCDTSIVVAEGSGNIPALLRWARSTGEDYFAIVDDDFGAELVYDEIEAEYGTDNILAVGEASGKESAVMLIDLFTSEFLEDCIQDVTNTSPSLDGKNVAEVLDPATMRKVVEEIVTRLDERKDVELRDLRNFGPMFWTIYEQCRSE